MAWFDGRSNAKYCSGSCRAKASKEARQNRNQAQPARTQRPSTALASALGKSITKTTKTPADGAAVQLARTYARHLDQHPEDLPKVGPQYLNVLDALGMTPNSRKSVPTRGGVDGGSTQRSALDELRRRREARAGTNRAAAVDPPAG